MKIAIPVKINRENPPVAPLFGKAKWFAFVKDGKIEIKPNPAEGGRAVMEWLMGEGVDTIIMQEMGRSPYNMIQARSGLRLFHSGYERILINDLLERFDNHTLTQLDDTSIHQILKHHEKRHPHHTHHHGQHHRGHNHTC